MIAQGGTNRGDARHRYESRRNAERGFEGLRKTRSLRRMAQKRGCQSLSEFLFSEPSEGRVGCMGAKGRQWRGGPYRQSAHAERLSRGRDQTRRQIRTGASSV